MGSSVPVGKFFGINVRINTTLLLVFAFFAYRGYTSGGMRGAADEVTFLVFIFISIFLHEMGHAGAAAAFGIRTLDVTLHFFGGYARLAEHSQRSLQDAAISIAGPLVNLAIAGALYLVLQTYHEGSLAFLSPYADLIEGLMYGNLVLAIFNLLPGYPLDGGHIVRAILSLFLSRPTARAISGYLGIIVGLGIAVWGFTPEFDAMTVVLGLLLAFIALGEATNARQSADMAP